MFLRRGPRIFSISIHAPREGGDSSFYLQFIGIKNFNPRPPRGGRHNAQSGHQTAINFNPRPPRGGRQYFAQWCYVLHDISIHAPREGGDFMFLRRGPRCLKISIHAPREGGDLVPFVIRKFLQKISIHAPREGGDVGVQMKSFNTKDFNPRPPRGGRQQRCTVLSVNL